VSLGLFIGVDGWTGATLGVQPTGGYGAETFDYDTEVGADGASHYTVAEAIVDWCNAAGRAWTGAVTFSWSLLDLDPHHGIRITASASTTWTSNLTMRTRMSWSAAPIGVNVDSGDGVVGSVRAGFAVRHGVKWARGAGLVSRAGSYMLGSQPFAPIRPTVASLLSEAQVNALTDGLAIAHSPRTGHVYSHAAQAWYPIHIAQANDIHMADSLNGHYQVTLGVLSDG
jgi:hypothetical protein